MKLGILFVCVAVVLFLVTNVNAKAFPTDIAGKFSDYQNDNPPSCPETITQTTFTDGLVSYSWEFPHHTVLHDNSRCDSTGAQVTVFYNDSLVPENVPQGLNHALNNHGVNLEIDYPLNHRAVTAGETYYIGYEKSGRYCQDGSKFDPGTVYFLFRPFLPVYMPIGTKFYSFEPEWKYMIVVPQFSDDYCVYKSFVPGAASDPALQKATLENEDSDIIDTTQDPEETVEIDDEGVEANETIEVSPQIDSEIEAETETSTEADETELAPSKVLETPAGNGDVMGVRPLLEGLVEPTVEPVVQKENSCFPEDQLVQLESGSQKLMKDLEIGDIVLSGMGSYSDVFMFTHKVEKISTWFVEITIDETVLKLSGGHYLEINGRLSMARHAKVGDMVHYAGRGETEIKAVRYVKSKGLYNPQTTHGTIVVNGIVVSCYTSSVEPYAAQALLSPLRTIFWLLGLSTHSLESGIV